MVDRLMQQTGIQDTLSLLVVLVLGLTAIVAVVVVLYIWAKFHSLPTSLKTFLVAAFLVLVAYSAGLWTPQGIAEALVKLNIAAADAYMRFDGYTRTNRSLGVIALALLVPLVATQGFRKGSR